MIYGHPLTFDKLKLFYRFTGSIFSLIFRSMDVRVSLLRRAGVQCVLLRYELLSSTMTCAESQNKYILLAKLSTTQLLNIIIMYTSCSETDLGLNLYVYK